MGDVPSWPAREFAIFFITDLQRATAMRIKNKRRAWRQGSEFLVFARYLLLFAVVPLLT